jgi:hypothetical protein
MNTEYSENPGESLLDEHYSQLLRYNTVDSCCGISIELREYDKTTAIVGNSAIDNITLSK